MPAPPGTVLIQLGPELLAAVRAHCKQRGVAVVPFVRGLVARAVKRSDLAKVRPRGRPRKA